MFYKYLYYYPQDFISDTDEVAEPVEVVENFDIDEELALPNDLYELISIGSDNGYSYHYRIKCLEKAYNNFDITNLDNFHLTELYFYLGLFNYNDSARFFYYQAIEIYEQTGDYHNIIICYSNLGEYEIALEVALKHNYQDRIIEYCKLLNKYDTLLKYALENNLYNEAAYSYFELKDYENAAIYYIKANNYYIAAIMYEIIRNYDKAIECYLIVDSFYEISQIYETIDNPVKAFEYYKLAIANDQAKEENINKIIKITCELYEQNKYDEVFSNLAFLLAYENDSLKINLLYGYACIESNIQDLAFISKLDDLIKKYELNQEIKIMQLYFLDKINIKYDDKINSIYIHYINLDENEISLYYNEKDIINLANILYKNKEYARVIQLLTYLDSDNDSINASKLLLIGKSYISGDLLSNLNNTNKKSYLKQIEKIIERKEIDVNLGYFYLIKGLFNYDSTNITNAIMEAFKYFPNVKPDSKYVYAYTLFEKRKYIECIEICELILTEKGFYYINESNVKLLLYKSYYHYGKDTDNEAFYHSAYNGFKEIINEIELVYSEANYYAYLTCNHLEQYAYLGKTYINKWEASK